MDVAHLVDLALELVELRLVDAEVLGLGFAGFCCAQVVFVVAAEDVALAVVVGDVVGSGSGSGAGELL